MSAPRSKSALDAAFVVRAQQGDEIARARLLRALEPILRGFFIKRAGHRAEIDDLVQNTLVRVHTGLGDLNDPARLKAFAMKAAFFELQDLYRGRYTARESLFDPDLPGPASPDTTASTGLGLDLDRALSELTDHAREIIELREQGYRYTEIAETLGTTEAAVKMQVKRAFQKLRGLLATFAATLAGSVTLLKLGAALAGLS
ncbi:MAG: sigma-70 family RNA polymerase sigma factor [Bacteroidota bacterium]